MNEFLEDLGKGSELNEAFEKAYMVSLSQMDQQWRNEFGEDSE
jgi:hypothetical protein